MAEKPVPNRGGKIIIDFPPGLPNHDVDDKEIPDMLLRPPYDIYMWVGNFRITDDKGGPAPPRLPIPYKVLVEKVNGKDKLVYWDGQSVKPLPIEGQATRGGRKYAVAKLDLGDPPVGWA
jgi:hypothetical protein